MVPSRHAHPALTRGSMADAVVEYVRAAIVGGTMVPGQWYSAYRLADQLGVSRSPVREGLLKLEEAGVIWFAKNRGFQVIPTSPEDVAEIFCIRAGLEVPAAGRAASGCGAELAERITALRSAMDQAAAVGDEDLFFQRDQELHAQLLTAAGMHRGRQIVDQLRVSTRLLGVSTSRGLRTLADISGEHAPIIEAVLARESAAACAAMQTHLAATGRLLVQQAMGGAAGDAYAGQAAAQLWDRLTEGFYGPNDAAFTR